MTAEEFVRLLDDDFPDMELLRRKYPKRDLYAYMEDYRIRFHQDRHPCTNELENLIYNTNISMVGIGSMDFYYEMKVFGSGFPRFASWNDHFRFHYSDEGKILYRSIEEDEYETAAVSLDQFFAFLLIYNRFDRHVIFGSIFPEEDKGRLDELVRNGFSRWWIRMLLVK